MYIPIYDCPVIALTPWRGVEEKKKRKVVVLGQFGESG
jgi:mRNA-degrading endonuclease toxin of MazEF toxin-antitoxin module